MAGLLRLMKRLRSGSGGSKNNKTNNNNTNGPANNTQGNRSRSLDVGDKYDKEHKTDNEMVSLVISAAVVFLVLYFISGTERSNNYNPDQRKLNNILFDLQDDVEN